MTLSQCDVEPIHIPGSIQPHGVLLVLSGDQLNVLQVSQNVGTWFALDAAECLGQSVELLIGPEMAMELRTNAAALPQGGRPLLLGALNVTGGHAFHALAHRTDDLIVLELEFAGDDLSVADPYVAVDRFSLRVEDATTVAAVAELVCEEVRNLTGFDRVLVYRFDENWNGRVIGEAGSGRLPSVYDHWFPATDIPAQARELYRTSRIRTIPDARYVPVPLTPPMLAETGKPLDMSNAALRSVSPVHLQYMSNMQTDASMSVSILRNGALWGLISCHHREARRVPFQVRTTCDLLARTLSLRLSGLEPSHEYKRRLEQKKSYAHLLAAMADRLDFVAPLTENADELLSFANATGAALVVDDQCVRIGHAPEEPSVRSLAVWLFDNVTEEVFATNDLASVYPPAVDLRETAAGVLAIQVSQRVPSFVLWFRSEVAQTIKWGGEPQKTEHVTEAGELVLSPRKSFETWRQTVLGTSSPWRPREIEAAAEFRQAVVGTVLRRAEELAALNAELLRSNQELEAFSYSVSHDLRAPLRHIAGYAELLREGASTALTARDLRFITTILESTEFAGNLVDRLLEFSRMGRSELHWARVDLNALVGEIRDDLAIESADRNIVWHIAALPVIPADPVMLRLLMRNLLENAVKYSRPRDQAVIEVECRDQGDEYAFAVRDNGVGFDMQYSEKIFGVFQRLHRLEDFPGTGIGLANVRRVLERHGGRIWVEAAENQGATFYFTLPKTSARASGETHDAESGLAGGGQPERPRTDVVGA